MDFESFDWLRLLGHACSVLRLGLEVARTFFSKKKRP